MHNCVSIKYYIITVLYVGIDKMPIFSKKSDRRKADGDKKPQPPPLPPPPEAQKPRPQSTFPIPHRHELVFHCQLAHGSSTREIKDFASVKDLYSRVAKAFEIESEEVCTTTISHMNMPIVGVV